MLVLETIQRTTVLTAELADHQVPTKFWKSSQEGMLLLSSRATRSPSMWAPIGTGLRDREAVFLPIAKLP